MNGEKSTQAVGRFFDGYAKDFDAIYGHTQQRSAFGRWTDRTFRRVMMQRFEETLRRCDNSDIHAILDIGCGPGRYAAALGEQGKDVVAIDIAEGMLDVAKARIDALDITGTVELVLGDYLTTSFDRKFDAACLMGFFDYIENPVPVIKKLAKEVTGEFYASFPKTKGFLAWQRQIRYRMRKCPLWLYSKPDVEDILVQGGFGGAYEIQDFGRDWYVTVQVQSEQ